MTKLKASSREINGKKVKNLRTEGQVPAVMYGPKFESKSIVLDQKEFRAVFKEAGFSNMIDVEIDGDKEKALVKEVQQHPVTDQFIHISMYVVDSKSPITADIPIEFTGESPAEKLGNGFVVFAMDNVAVRCLPADLPSHLSVDVTKLEEAGENILVEDIELPEGVEFDSKTDQGAPVAYVATAQKVEDVLAEIEADHAAEGSDEDEEDAVEGEEGEEGEAEAGDEETAEAEEKE